jgi:hypothetical protein
MGEGFWCACAAVDRVSAETPREIPLRHEQTDRGHCEARLEKPPGQSPISRLSVGSPKRAAAIGLRRILSAIHTCIVRRRALP